MEDKRLNVKDKRKEINVAYMIPSLEVGGAETQGIFRINALHNLGYQIFPMILSNQTSLLDELIVPADRIYIQENNPYHLYNRRGFAAVHRGLWEMMKFIRTHRIKKLVASMNLSHYAARFLKMLLRLQGYRLQIYIYHHSSFYDMNPANTLLKRATNQLISLQARFLDDRTLFVSYYVRNFIMRHSFVRNPFVLYNSVRVPEEYQSSRVVSSSDSLVFRMLIPGRIHYIKGQDLFAEAFKTFVEKENISPSECEVLIAGGGDEKFLEQVLDSFQISDFFKFLGVLSKKELYKLYKKVDLMVIPSRFEGLGNVAIEGLMFNVCMLVSNTGGLKEIIEDGVTGFFFRSGDKDDLTAKLISLYREKPMPDAQAQARVFRERFHPEAHIQQLCQLLELPER